VNNPDRWDRRLEEQSTLCLFVNSCHFSPATKASVSTNLADTRGEEVDPKFTFTRQAYPSNRCFIRLPPTSNLPGPFLIKSPFNQDGIEPAVIVMGTSLNSLEMEVKEEGYWRGVT
jgi:hypothetical protein